MENAPARNLFWTTIEAKYNKNSFWKAMYFSGHSSFTTNYSGHRLIRHPQNTVILSELPEVSN